MWEYTGPFRVHFNKKDEAPRLASITNSDHSWEVICKSVDISGDVTLVSGGDLNAVPQSPIWWLSGVAKIVVDEFGHASIRPAPRVERIPAKAGT